MATRDFTLFDCKAEGYAPTNWSGVPLEHPDEVFAKLRVGDAVRLLLQAKQGRGWEKIYFQITDISHYSKGGSAKPKTFRGVALDTYRMNDDQYVRTGDEITFQRRNIIEVPDWRGTPEEIRAIARRQGKAAALPSDQAAGAAVDRSLRYLSAREYLDAEREWERQHRG